MPDLRPLCRVLLDDDALRDVGQDAIAQQRLWDQAVDHYAHLCLAWRVTGDAGASWSDALRSAARATLADAAVLEEMQRRELLAVTGALSAAGVDLLLLKGSALAYQVYPHPWLRSRDDTDVLIRAGDLARATSVLLSLEYVPASENTAPLATAQRHFHRLDRQKFTHPVDVHWRVTNPLVFADALPFERVWARSVAIAALGGARALCAVDALLLACLHRLAHHGNDSSLLWVYDIHRLSAGLGQGEWNELVEAAITNAAAGACFQGLSRSAEMFGTAVPPHALSRLESAARPEERAFFVERMSPFRMLVSDWRALQSWSGRLRLLGAHVFPEPAYIASKYRTNNRALLPLLYAHRALAGLPRWLSVAVMHRDRAQGREQETVRRHP